MAVIPTMDGLRAVDRTYSPTLSFGRGGVSLYGNTFETYERIYRSQPALRTVVDFLGRNMGQLGWHVFKKLEQNDRQRLEDHQYALTLSRPNHYTTPFRLKRDTIQDLAIYDEAFWVIVENPNPDGKQKYMLVRIPPKRMVLIGDSWMEADGYLLKGNRGDYALKANEVVHFHGYNPEDPRTGVSPIETLRLILAEESAMGDYRKDFWRNGARVEGVIQRPVEAPRWSKEARSRFRSAWEARHAGNAGAGKTAILEEGMEFHQVQWSAKEAEYLEGRKLTREECARAYHIPLPMVGILDHATYGNVEEQHGHLYQDTLPPWCVMLEEDSDLQLLGYMEAQDATIDVAGVYSEFNIQEKLKGSFEEQAKVMQTMTGGPVITRNEARGRLNLPRIDDPAADELIVPLNVLVGGVASPTDTAPKEPSTEGQPKKSQDGTKAIKALEEIASMEPPAWAGLKADVDNLVDQAESEHQKAMEAFFKKQAQVVKSKMGAKASTEVLHRKRWDKELATTLKSLGMAATVRAATKEDSEYDAEAPTAYVEESSRIAAEEINATTEEALKAALEEDDPQAAVAAIFVTATTSRAEQIAQTRATHFTNFGRHDAAEKGGKSTKEWVVTSGKSRHPQMHGETVSMGDTFSNGGRFPGDPSLGVEETAKCQCLLQFGEE